MITVCHLNSGQRFRFPHQPNDVYEFIKNDPDEKGVINNCLIKRVAFYMDGSWHPDNHQDEQNCNPYARVKVVKFNVYKEE